MAIAVLVAALLGSATNGGATDAPRGADGARSMPAGAEWFADAKLGIIVHWGPYSVPAWADDTVVERGLPVGLAYAEWYWYQQTLLPDGPVGTHHRETYGEDVLYDDFLDRWHAERYDPEAWMDLFSRAGAQYAVLTAKHHDGWALFDSAASRRDTVDDGPHRDLVRGFVDAARHHDMHVGLYYSLMEWFHPAYTADHGSQHLGGSDLLVPKLDPRNPYTGAPVPYRGYDEPVDDYVRDHVHVQVDELLYGYQPDLLWCDADWDVPADAYWQLGGLLDDYRSSGRTVLVNDRCALPGDYTTLEYAPSIEPQDRYFEATRGLGTSFGYNANETSEDLLTGDEAIALLVDVVAKGGNLLLNVGPRADGAIPQMQQERLVALGDWLEVNGEAIYGTRPVDPGLEGDVRATRGDEATYLLLLSWPDDGVLEVPASIDLADHFEYDVLGTDVPARRSGVDPRRLELGAAPGEAAAWAVRLRAVGADERSDRDEGEQSRTTPVLALIVGGALLLGAIGLGRRRRRAAHSPSSAETGSTPRS